MTWTEIFDKVKAAGATALAVGLLAVLAIPLENWDWEKAVTVFIAAALPVVAAVLKRELTAYGVGVQRPEQQLPGGTPLPTGADQEPLP